MAVKISKFFQELFSTDTAEGAADAAKATIDLAKSLNQTEIQNLVPIIERGGFLLEALNSPWAELAETTLPFVKVATGFLKFYIKVRQKEPTLVEEIVLVSQAAYLESFTTFTASRPQFRDWFKQKVTQLPSEIVKREFKQLGELEIDDRTARIALVNFQESSLAQAYNQALSARLTDLGLSDQHIAFVIQHVAANTHQFLLTALAELGDSAKRILTWYQVGGREEFEKYLSIDEYLEREIRSKPAETIFDEEQITFRDLYVPLKVRRLDRSGHALEEEAIDVEGWVCKTLERWEHEPSERRGANSLDGVVPKKSILFIQGEAGRGKSVFCRMFADRVRRDLATFTPIVIRLRHLRVLGNSLTQTLTTYLENWDFVTNDSGWLTDKNIRFLIFLDGFDELLLEDRATGGVKEFLQQVEVFQGNSHHRFIVTGRPLALQGIDRLINQTDNLERVELQPMDDPLRTQWLSQWQVYVGEAETQAFWNFLQACPQDVKDELAREPLLLYLLARMHREQQLQVQMFVDAKGIQAKIQIYDTAVNWVLEKQRQKENLRLTGLEHEELRQVLTEAAVCVVQSGNECAKISMLETRLKESHNRVSVLIQQARQETQLADDRVLNNLLTAFYLKPASGDTGGAVEFAHKSFSEFLFAERLKEAIEDWSKPGDRRREFYVADRDLHWELYDLLGYGGLTLEIVEYLMEFLDRSQRADWVRLFHRLNDFYIRWTEGEFIDADSPTLPQQKMLRLRSQVGEREVQLGQRQVDVYTGLNVMILLLELHRYAHERDALKEAIEFKICWKEVPDRFYNPQLLEIIGYSCCISDTTFLNITGRFLNQITLSGTDLNHSNFSNANFRNTSFRGTNLKHTDFSRADLSGADLSSAALISANLRQANLIRANLVGANLIGANLVEANFRSANLEGIDFSHANLTHADLSYTNLEGANFIGANLKGANFKGANLSRANFSRAHLNYANLSLTNLSRADLSLTDLSRTNLNRADLSYTYLKSANLNNADFGLTNLGAIFWNEETSWEGVRGLETARNVPEKLRQQLGLVEIGREE